MIVKISTYTINKDKLKKVVQAIKVFIKAIRKNEPDTFYEAYREKDSMNFIHLMKFPNATAEKRHATASYTQKFVSILYPLCTKEPEFTDLTQIGGEKL